MDRRYAPSVAAAPAPAASLYPAGFFALGTFAIGTEGFMIAPLMPKMASDFGMSIFAVAALVVVFTLALSLSSPVTTVLSARLNRRDTLLLAIVVFTAANVAAALSTGFAGLLVARIVMAIAAGLYVPNANALAGTLAGPARRGRALAIVSGGMTIAIALGLPLGAIVGHAWGWRATFLAVAAMGATACIGILAGVSRHDGGAAAVASIADRIGVVKQPQVRRLLAVTLLWSVGAYTSYPFIASYLHAVLRYDEAGISATVTLWGVFAALGVLTGGVLNDRLGADRVVRVALVLLTAAFWTIAAATTLAPALAQWPVLVAVAVWGFSVWAFFPAQMARLIGAGEAVQAPVALSLNTSTMYLGFSVGSAVGAGILHTVRCGASAWQPARPKPPPCCWRTAMAGRDECQSSRLRRCSACVRLLASRPGPCAAGPYDGRLGGAAGARGGSLHRQRHRGSDRPGRHAVPARRPGLLCPTRHTRPHRHDPAPGR
jgi:DHA1 family purine base/nucleoside efflux pump-like MFS transporter